MSYRELRSFTESLRALGYPRAISISSFQAPNFKLVADIMYWLTAEVLDCVDIPLDIDTPDKRVEFLQAVHEAILSRTGVNISAKNLYKADGHAVREMNKVILLLYRAALTVQPQSSVQNASVGAHLALTNHMDKLKRSKAMAASVAQCGEHLASLLASGKDARLNSALAVPDTTLPSLASSQLASLQSQVTSLSHSLQSLSRSAETATTKLRARKEEADREDRRLQAMGQVKAAFSDEYTQLEGTAAQLYQEYVSKYRVLQDLELRTSQLEQQNRQEMAKIVTDLQRLQAKKGERDHNVLMAHEDVDRSGLYDSDIENEEELGTILSKPLRNKKPTSGGDNPEEELGYYKSGKYGSGKNRYAATHSQLHSQSHDDFDDDMEEYPASNGKTVRMRNLLDDDDDPDDDIPENDFRNNDFGAFRDLSEYDTDGMGAMSSGRDMDNFGLSGKNFGNVGSGMSSKKKSSVYDDDDDDLADADF